MKYLLKFSALIVRGNGGENGLAVAEVHPGNGRPGGRTARNVTRDDARLLDDVAPVLPTTATGRATISDSRNSQAGELLPGGRLVVNFYDDPGWDHSRLFLWPIDANTWIVLTLTINMRRKCRIIRRCEYLPIGEGQIRGDGSVEFNRGWTLNELSELVREGRNLALCARTSMGLTHYRDPTMMCDLSGRLFNVPPVTWVNVPDVELFEHCRCGELPLQIHLHHHATRLLTLALRLAYGRIE